MLGCAFGTAGLEGATFAHADRPAAVRGLAMAAAPTFAFAGYALFIAWVVAGGGFS